MNTTDPVEIIHYVTNKRGIIERAAFDLQRFSPGELLQYLQVDYPAARWDQATLSKNLTLMRNAGLIKEDATLKQTLNTRKRYVWNATAKEPAKVGVSIEKRCALDHPALATDAEFEAQVMAQYEREKAEDEARVAARWAHHHSKM